MVANEESIRLAGDLSWLQSVLGVEFSLVLWHCLLGDRKGMQPVGL